MDKNLIGITLVIFPFSFQYTRGAYSEPCGGIQRCIEIFNFLLHFINITVVIISSQLFWSTNNARHHALIQKGTTWLFYTPIHLINVEFIISWTMMMMRYASTHELNRTGTPHTHTHTFWIENDDEWSETDI